MKLFVFNNFLTIHKERFEIHAVSFKEMQKGITADCFKFTYLLAPKNCHGLLLVY